MIIATLTKALAGVTLLGAAATTVFVVLPHPESHNGIWLDTPLAGTVVEAGDVRVVLHSDVPNIFAMRVEATRDGEVTFVLKDTELERVQRGKGAQSLSVFDQEWWVDEPGVYTLNVSVSGATVVRSFEITVLPQNSVFVDTAQASGPAPTETPTPTPTSEPTEQPTLAPEPDDPVVPGSVTRFQPGDDDWLSYFYINSFAPENADVTLQLRITDSLNGVPGEWQEYPCYGNTPEGTPGIYNCVISDHYLEPQASFQIDGTWMPFSVEYYAIISTSGESAYSPGGTWETARR